MSECRAGSAIQHASNPPSKLDGNLGRGDVVINGRSSALGDGGLVSHATVDLGRDAHCGRGQPVAVSSLTAQC